MGKKIPTAQEFLNVALHNEVHNNYDTRYAMIEFARLHVKEALKMASDELIDEFKTLSDFKNAKSSILSSYSLDNIK